MDISFLNKELIKKVTAPGLASPIAYTTETKGKFEGLA